MENGIYMARKTAARVDGVYIDEERLELEYLNRRTETRRQAAEKAAAEQSKKRREAQARADKRRRAENRALLRGLVREGELLIFAWLLSLAQGRGLIAWELAVPLIVACQAVICLRAGWMLRGAKKEKRKAA